MSGENFIVADEDPTIISSSTETPPQPTFLSSLPLQEDKSKDNTEPSPEQQTVDLNSVIQKFISERNPKLYILTPCYGAMCCVDYMSSLIKTLELFRSIQFPVQVEFCKNDSLVSRARNNLIARAMNDPACTHIMFIDSDISWTPFDILKLMLADKNVCGGIYPLKHYHWEHLLKHPSVTDDSNSSVVKSLVDRKNGSQLQSFISDEKMLQYNLLRYNFNSMDNQISITNNFAEVRHIATGFVMMKRSVFENLFKAFPSSKYKDDVMFARPGEEEFSYAIFDTGCENGHYFSEDWMFCSRWNKLGGKIFVDVSINLNHIGMETYSGSFVSTIIR